jgi:chromosome partitioning protein
VRRGAVQAYSGPAVRASAVAVVLHAIKNACQIASCQRSFPAMIIALVNSKGGVGKSTIAGNLTGWLHLQGKKVILVDCDSQQSSSEWIREALPEVQVVRLSTADEILDELPSLAGEADFIVADGPGSQTETSRALLMWAELAIVPCKASMFEARALDKNTAFIRQAQAIRKGPPEAVAVLSMVGRDYRLTKDMREAAATLKLNLTDTPVTLRQAYADAPGQATFVWNMGAAVKTAADEVDALFREILPGVGDEKILPIRARARANR